MPSMVLLASVVQVLSKIIPTYGTLSLVFWTHMFAISDTTKGEVLKACTIEGMGFEWQRCTKYSLFSTGWELLRINIRRFAERYPRVWYDLTLPCVAFDSAIQKLYQKNI